MARVPKKMTRVLAPPRFYVIESHRTWQKCLSATSMSRRDPHLIR